MSHGLTPRRLTSRLVALTVAALVLGGCSDEGDGEATPTPSGTSSSGSEPSEPTSSAAPQVPELPEAATGTDDAAAVAFVEHWVELVNYGLATGDTEPLSAAQNPDCLTCAAILQETAAQAGATPIGDVGSWTATGVESRAGESADPAGTDYVVEMDITIQGSDPAPFGHMSLGVSRAENEWRVEWLLSEAY